MEDASKLEWCILDALSNDTECVAIIWPYVKDTLPDISGDKLKDTIYKLYKRGLVYIESETAPVDREDILAEETTNQNSIGNYYFGLTPAGVELWEEASKKYDEPVDWSNSWIVHYDVEHQEGYINGTSREVCLNQLIRDNQSSYSLLEEWQVDMNSLVHSNVKGFQAKYYKYISGGHRIRFKLKKRG
jgi:hypothetical protein